jgi:energy-converting hydrogenase Eha subunit F
MIALYIAKSAVLFSTACSAAYGTLLDKALYTDGTVTSSSKSSDLLRFIAFYATLAGISTDVL